MILGAHVSSNGGVSNAPLNAKELGVKAFQLFTKNQNRCLSMADYTRNLEVLHKLCVNHSIHKPDQ